MEQFGPYVYREHQVFSDVEYDQDLPVTGLSDKSFSDHVDQQRKATGLLANYN